MKLLPSVIAALVTIGIVACGKKSVDKPVFPDTGPGGKELGIYAKPPLGYWGANNPIVSTGWVGDVMPYYDKGQFHIFFLHDATDSEKAKSAGQHPIHKFTSSDLAKFAYEGEMIPYGNQSNAEYLIGTGSVLKYQDTYYFYYTGHNGSSSWTSTNPREVVLKATSPDLKNWTKKTDFKLSASDGYERGDFRDPDVFFNPEFNEYWMLVSTRKNGKGVLALYTTTNPAADNWILQQPLNIEGDFLMLECADIFKMGNYYYMFFSEDWTSSPGTRYRIATSSAGPWKKPADGNDMVDGHMFYGGKTASDGNNRYVFAWTHRRNPETDNGNRTWGGNLVVHQLTQSANGGLGVKPPQAVNSAFTKDTELKGLSLLGSVSESGNSFQLNGNTSLAAKTFTPLIGSMKITATINMEKSTGTAGFVFNAGTIASPTYKILFEPQSSRIAAYNIIGGINSEVTRVPFQIQSGTAYSVEIIIDGSVCTMYVNGRVALANRIYSLAGNPWGIIAEGNQAVFSNIKVTSP